MPDETIGKPSGSGIIGGVLELKQDMINSTTLVLAKSRIHVSTYPQK